MNWGFVAECIPYCVGVVVVLVLEIGLPDAAFTVTPTRGRLGKFEKAQQEKDQ